ncbi:MAG TPA: hypothetical protein VMT28_01795 [Terriglobales bacterium]|jgi:hypothetical protein|nr:hypothetical protein [Terriglobales bacterium]
MFPRFAAGCAIASIAIALGALVIALTPGLTFERVYPLTIIWCVAPLAWGVWALLAPATWVPQRLPLWGAILGLIAGSLAAYVLNLPSRVLGETLSVVGRTVAMLVLMVFYYVLWMLVRMAYRSLASTTSGR